MSKKYIKTIILIFTTFLVLLVCDSFCASTDNDGSAFITKAEFDALKSSFQSQIDSYNASIDSKIDDAISSYLNGLSIIKSKEIEPLVANYNLIRWQTGPYWYNTKRQFNAARTDGAYTDTKAWQMMDFKLFRNFRDAYWFCYDFITTSYLTFANSFMLYINTHDDKFLNCYNSPYGCFPAFLQLTKMDGGYGWKKSAAWDDILYAEENTTMILDAKGHLPTSGVGGGNPDPWVSSGVGVRKRASNISVSAGTSISSNDILTYRLNGFYPASGTTEFFIQSNVDNRMVNFPYATYKKGTNAWRRTLATNLWKTGTEKTSALNITSGTLPYDYTWSSDDQLRNDLTNFGYIMLGKNQTTMVNFAIDPITDSNGTFLDLSNSGNVAVVPCQAERFKTNPTTGFVASSTSGMAQYPMLTVDGTLNVDINIPLWYREQIQKIRNGNFEYEGGHLQLGQGMPIIENASEKYNVIISFDYKEHSNAVDTTVSVDDKIYIDFAKNNFNNSTITYCSGIVNKETSLRTLNRVYYDPIGGEKKLSFKIPIDKGDDIWMRIDPDSTNGIYCDISNLKIVLEAS